MDKGVPSIPSIRIALILLASTGSMHGQTAAYSPPAPWLDSTPVSISGQVYDAQNRPMAGATVTLSGATNGTAITDATGAYRFSGLVRGGSYTVAVSKSGSAFLNPTTYVGQVQVGADGINFLENAACQYSMGILTNFLYSGGRQGSTMTTTSNCPWLAAGNAGGWVTVTPGSGSGPAVINVQVEPFYQDVGATSLPRGGAAGAAGQMTRFTQSAQYLTPGYTFSDQLNGRSIYEDPGYSFESEAGIGNYLALTKAYLVTAGCGSGQYCPTDPLPRKQIATMLVHALLYAPGDCDPALTPGSGCVRICKHGFPKTEEPNCGFETNTVQYYTDIANTDVYRPYIQKAAELGITSDCDYVGSQRFCPDTPTTRGAMAEMVIKAMMYKQTIPSPLGYPSQPYFTDVSSVSRYFPYVQKLREQGVTTGKDSATTYKPDDTLERYQMAVFAIRALFTEAPLPTVNITPKAVAVGASGAARNLQVSAAPATQWNASSLQPSWINVNSGSSGSGNGTVGYTVAANAGGYRSSGISIGGQIFNVEQAGNDNVNLPPRLVSVSLSPTSANTSDATMTFTFSDANGNSNLAATRLVISSGDPVGTPACAVTYYRQSNQLILRGIPGF